MCLCTPTTEFLFDLQVGDVLKQVNGKKSDADLARHAYCRCAERDRITLVPELRRPGVQSVGNFKHAFATERHRNEAFCAALDTSLKNGDQTPLRTMAAASEHRRASMRHNISLLARQLACDAAGLADALTACGVSAASQEERDGLLVTMARCGNEQGVRQLLRGTFSTNTKNWALAAAAEAGSVGTTALLVRSGVDPRAVLAELSNDRSVDGTALSARVSATLRDAGGI
jgi:hypothetical protein